MLRPQSRTVVVPDAKVLFKWGLRLMQTAKLDAPRRADLIRYRNGLLIAMFASRARRLRSMSLLRIGHEFTRIADFYRAELQPEQVKTGKYDVFTLPKSLTPYIEKYLETVRPALLRGKRHDALWIGINGKQLERKGIEGMVGRRSKARFDVTFGPHRFRHAIATTAPLRAPEHPGPGGAPPGHLEGGGGAALQSEPAGFCGSDVSGDHRGEDGNVRWTLSCRPLTLLGGIRYPSPTSLFIDTRLYVGSGHATQTAR